MKLKRCDMTNEYKDIVLSELEAAVVKITPEILDRLDLTGATLAQADLSGIKAHLINASGCDQKNPSLGSRILIVLGLK